MTISGSRLGGWRRAALVALVASPALAQPELGDGPLPAFEYARVLPSHPANGPIVDVSLDSGAFTARGVSLERLAAFAYDIEMDKVVGGPEWMTSSYYEIEARAQEAAGPATARWTMDEIRQRAQGMLLDHFGLRAHREQAPLYILELAPDGPGMTPSAPGAEDGDAVLDERQGGAWIGRSIPASALAAALQRRLARPVLDRTGLTERYDFELRWDPEAAAPYGLTAALREQLGLVLRSIPLEQLVIDAAYELPPELGRGHVFEPVSEP